MDGLFDVPARAPRGGTPPGVLFAEDFDQPAPATAPVRPSFTAEDVAAVRAAAFAEGRDLGFATAATEHEVALAAAAARIAERLAALRAEAEAATEAAAKHVATLLLGTLAALFPALCARHGVQEADAVLRAVLPGLGEQPSLRLAANPRLLPALQDSLARHDATLAARTEFVPSELAAAGDIDLRWQQGGASRSAAGLWAAVAAALAPAGFILAPIVETADAR